VRAALVGVFVLVAAACGDRRGTGDAGSAPPPVDAAIDAQRAPDPARQHQARVANAEGDRCAAAGRSADAIAAFERAVDLDPAYSRAWANLGWARFGAGDLRGAAAANQRALALAGDDPELLGSAHYNLGRVAQAQGDLIAAREAYRASLRARPHAGVAARLEALDSPAERAADVDLLVAAPPTAAAGRDVVASSAGAALARLGVAGTPLVADPSFGLGGHDSLVVVGRRAGGRWASLVLGAGHLVKIRAEDLDGDGAEERVIEGDQRIWIVDLGAEGPRCQLELPVGTSFHAGAKGELIVDEGTDPAGPQGRYRLVEGRFRKLEM
jgi:tetratricopeptide (TPR) repeat protein